MTNLLYQIAIALMMTIIIYFYNKEKKNSKKIAYHNKRKFDSEEISSNQKKKINKARKMIHKGQSREGIEVLVKAGLMREAIDLLIQVGEIDQAAKVLIRFNLHARAGNIYTFHGKWQKAAVCYNAAGSFNDEAKAYRTGGNYSKAAEIFIKSGNSEDAADCLVQGGMIREASDLYFQLDNIEKATPLFEKCLVQFQPNLICLTDKSLEALMKNFNKLVPSKELVEFLFEKQCFYTLIENSIDSNYIENTINLLKVAPNSTYRDIFERYGTNHRLSEKIAFVILRAKDIPITKLLEKNIDLIAKEENSNLIKIAQYKKDLLNAYLPKIKSQSLASHGILQGTIKRHNIESPKFPSKLPVGF